MVLDTAVMVAAIRSDRGASRRLLVAALNRRVALLVSTPLLLEYEAVMTRPEHLQTSGLSGGEVSALLDAVAAVAAPVKLAFLWRPALPDPDDDMVLETALNGSADLIATFNLRDFAPAAGRFGIEVMRPGEVIRRMENLQ